MDHTKIIRANKKIIAEHPIGTTLDLQIDIVFMCECDIYKQVGWLGFMAYQPL